MLDGGLDETGLSGRLQQLDDYLADVLSVLGRVAVAIRVIAIEPQLVSQLCGTHSDG